MNNLSRILVPVDFADNSILTVRHAADLARHFHSEITLLHVNEFAVMHPGSGALGYGITSSEAIREEHIAARRKELEGFAAAELQGIPVKRVMRCGDPALLIVEHARTEKTSLIVMPARGGGMFRRLLLGSVTAKVLHDAECPVWTGTHLAESGIGEPTEVRHVMCAVNFGPESQSAVRWAANFAAEFRARLTVVHATLGEPPNLPERYSHQWHDEARWGAEERLRSLLLDANVVADTAVVEGDLAPALAAAARNLKAGLLVIGRTIVSPSRISRGHGGRLGSDAYGIIRQAPCPVVSV